MKKILFLFLILSLNLIGCERPKENSSNIDEYSIEQEMEKSNANLKTIFEGNRNAKIHLIVYESLTCGACAHFHKKVYPNLKQDFISKGLVKIEFRNFPLDLAALNASKIAHCRKNGKSDILHFLFENQKKWADVENLDQANMKLKKILNDKYSDISFEKCLNDKVIEDHILEDRITGVKKFKINSTPTLIINKKKFDYPLDYEKLKKTLKKMI